MNKLVALPTQQDSHSESQLNQISEDNIPFHQIPFKKLISDMLLNVIPDSLTVSVGYFSGLIILLANLAFIGRTSNSDKLAAVGLGNVWINFIGINIVFGLNYGFETIASRVFGAGKKNLMILYLKKSILMNIVVMMICFVLMIYTKEILVFFGQDEKISAISYTYVIAMFPGSFALAFYDLLIMFLNAQNVFRPAMYIQIITTILHFGFCYFFLHIMDLGVLGIALAMDITQTLNLLFLLIFLIYYWKGREISFEPSFFNKKVWLNNWLRYFKIVIPISMSIILEYASYEVNSVIAGLLQSSVTLAAHVSLANTGSVIYCIPEGFSTAITTFVGNAVGENKKFKAQKFAILGNISGLFFLLLLMLFLSLTKNLWPSYFSDDKDVTKRITDLLPLFIIMNILDTMQMNLSAVLKALGKQNLTLFIYFVCLYLIANPSSYLFGITAKGDLEGIWYGIILGNFCMVVWFIILLLRTDWDVEIKKCIEEEQREGEDELITLETDLSVLSDNKRSSNSLMKESTEISTKGIIIEMENKDDKNK